MEYKAMTSSIDYVSTGPALAVDLGKPFGVAAAIRGAMLSTTINVSGRGIDPMPLAGVLTELESLVAATGATKLAYRVVGKRRARRRSNPLLSAQRALVTWAKTKRLELVPVTDFQMRRVFNVGGNSPHVHMAYAAVHRGHNPGSVAEANAIALLHCAISGGDYEAETIVLSR